MPLLNRAKQIRLDANVGISETAKKAGIARKTLRKIEDGEDVQVAAVARLSAFYGVKASDLYAPALVREPNERAA